MRRTTMWGLATLLALFPGMAWAAEGEIDRLNTAWVLICAALVLLMTPGLAVFYAGMVRSKNVLSTLMHSFLATFFAVAAALLRRTKVSGGSGRKRRRAAA